MKHACLLTVYKNTKYDTTIPSIAAKGSMVKKNMWQVFENYQIWTTHLIIWCTHIKTFWHFRFSLLNSNQTLMKLLQKIFFFFYAKHCHYPSLVREEKSLLPQAKSFKVKSVQLSYAWTHNSVPSTETQITCSTVMICGIWCDITVSSWPISGRPFQECWWTAVHSSPLSHRLVAERETTNTISYM